MHGEKAVGVRKVQKWFEKFKDVESGFRDKSR